MPRGSGDVTIRIAAEDAGAVLAWAKLRAQGPQGFERDVRKMGRTTRREARRGGAGMRGLNSEINRAAGSLIGMGSGLASIASFAMVVRQEFENLQRMQNLSGTSQVTFANAFRRAAYALGEGDLNVDQLQDLLLSNTSGVPKPMLALEAEAALSARGALQSSQAAGTVGAAARLRPDLDTESRRSLVGAALALQKNFPGVTQEQAVAGVLQSLQAARTEQLDVFAKNMISGIAQSRGFGGDQDTFRFLSSLFIGVGQRSEDPTGRRTATNTIKFLEQISTLAATRGVVRPGTSTEQTLDALLTGKPGSEAEKLRQDLVGVFDKNLDEVGREFQELKKTLLLGEARQRVSLLEILDRSKTSRTWQEILTAQEKIIGLNDRSVAAIEKVHEDLRRLPEQQAAETQRAFTQGIERMRIRDPQGITGITREQISEVLQRGGLTGMETALQNVMQTHGAATGGDQIEQLQRLRGRLTSRAGEIESGSMLDQTRGYGRLASWLIRAVPSTALMEQMGYFRRGTPAGQEIAARLPTVDETVAKELRQIAELLREQINRQEAMQQRQEDVIRLQMDRTQNRRPDRPEVGRVRETQRPVDQQVRRPPSVDTPAEVPVG